MKSLEIILVRHGHRRQSLCCLETKKMLHGVTLHAVIDGHQAEIQLAKTTRGEFINPLRENYFSYR